MLRGARYQQELGIKVATQLVSDNSSLGVTVRHNEV